ncbi:hypothetical protein SLS62_007536 [Diatrype stigma]|uniref:N-acetyltransferase domain-containing protein n=1 Tax=Diatrype stigma TaxID=117547 RepID=A0AAN9YQN6_9PEZI
MALPFPPPTALLSSPSFVVSQPSDADVDAMAEVYYESFMTDPQNTYWWSRDRAAQVAWLRRRLRSKLRDPATRHFKIVDASSDDEIVAWARWTVPSGPSAGAFGVGFGAGAGAGESGHVHGHELGKNKAPEDTASSTSTTSATAINIEGGGAAGTAAPSTVDVPEGTDPAVVQHFFQAMVDMSQKWDSSSMLCLSVLCTSPRYFKRGAAKALLVPVLNIADAEGLRTYLEATAAGRPVYEKLGFRQVDVLRFDTAGAVEGRPEPFEVAIMIREPKKVGAN